LVPFASRTREGGRWSEEEASRGDEIVLFYVDIELDLYLTHTGGALPFSVIHTPTWRAST
jgi:hypothetical protein